MTNINGIKLTFNHSSNRISDAIGVSLTELERINDMTWYVLQEEFNKSTSHSKVIEVLYNFLKEEDLSTDVKAICLYIVINSLYSSINDNDDELKEMFKTISVN